MIPSLARNFKKTGSNKPGRSKIYKPLVSFRQRCSHDENLSGIPTRAQTVKIIEW